MASPWPTSRKVTVRRPWLGAEAASQSSPQARASNTASPPVGSRRGMRGCRAAGVLEVDPSKVDGSNGKAGEEADDRDEVRGGRPREPADERSVARQDEGSDGREARRNSNYYESRDREEVGERRGERDAVEIDRNDGERQSRDFEQHLRERELGYRGGAGREVLEDSGQPWRQQYQAKGGRKAERLRNKETPFTSSRLITIELGKMPRTST